MSDLGKWAQAGVPKKDWSLQCVYDSRHGSGIITDGNVTEVADESPTNGDLQLCQMCEHEWIRWVHVVTHVEYPKELHVGCICSGHMTSDLKNAKARQADAISRSARRTKFPTLKKWKTSSKGNLTLIHKRHRCTVFAHGNGWKVCIQDPPIFVREENIYRQGEAVFKTATYATIRDAKLACFDEIEAP